LRRGPKAESRNIRKASGPRIKENRKRGEAKITISIHLKRGVNAAENLKEHSFVLSRGKVRLGGGGGKRGTKKEKASKRGELWGWYQTVKDPGPGKTEEGKRAALGHHSKGPW